MEKFSKQNFAEAYQILKVNSAISPESIDTLMAATVRYGTTVFPAYGKIRSYDFISEHRNGTDVSNYVFGCAANIFSHGYLMSLEDSIRDYLFMTKNELWSRTFFPIVTNGGGDSLLYDLLDGQIYYYGPPVLLSPFPDSIFDSLFLMFKTIESGYARNVYSITEGNQLKISWPLASEIAASLNPGSRFYKD